MKMGDVNTVTRADLSEAIHNEIGLSRAECLDLVESVINHMGDALAKGKNVKISGFGTFVLRDKSARVGRNPMTGIEVPIAPRRVLTFRPSPKMRERVAGSH
jgi:integration host factor subunit alpha